MEKVFLQKVVWRCYKLKAIRRFVKIPENHVISIEIPADFKVDEIAEILLILDRKDKNKNKYDLTNAMKDPLFVEDMNEVMTDFSNVDNEDW